ncbi:MAG: Type 1 glutamine amidotransferase-like domain-containing protein [Planctomycetota bacterium]
MIRFDGDYLHDCNANWYDLRMILPQRFFLPLQKINLPIGLLCLIALVSSGCQAGGSAKGALDLEEDTLAIEERLSPIRGSLMLRSGMVDGYTAEIFFRLGEGVEGKFLLLSDSRSSNMPATRALVEAGRCREFVVDATDSFMSSERIRALVNATGVWVSADFANHTDRAILRDLLEAVMRRGGVVGGSGGGLSTLVDVLAENGTASSGLGLLPGAIVGVGNEDASDRLKLETAVAERPGSVGWGLPEDCVMVVYAGRRVGFLGSGEGYAVIPERGGWPARVAVVDAERKDTVATTLPYQYDLISWNRSALDRLGPVFPAEDSLTPSVANGTLLIYGGNRTTDTMWDRFIESAGGKDANFVCIPTAGRTEEYIDDTASFGYRALKQRGCENVRVLHTHRRARANADETLIDCLENADGVWIGGGRTYRMMDAYERTRVHEMLKGVLDRGGAIAGSSAGAQVQGDFLVRGDPRNNVDPIVFDGYLRGLGLIEGVIIDAHFSQRKRQVPFSALIDTYPQMLGIGIDENTGLIIRGSGAEVVGEFNVTFYDHSGTHKRAAVLAAGDRYDLAKRRELERDN